MKTLQQNTWAGEFGKEYTLRNSFIDKDGFNFENWDKCLVESIGMAHTEINELFFRDLEVDSVLEVGSNMGLQLNGYEKMEMFSKICGVEIQRSAISKSREVFPDAHFDIVRGLAEDVPFKDSSFDLVVTNGLLIHISPDTLKNVMHQVYRCSRRYIFGYEYFGADENAQYRGSAELLFRRDFCADYLREFPDLHIVKRKRVSHSSNSSNIDDMFLLEKRKK